MGSNRVKVYDLATRVFHWVFAVLFTAAFLIGKVWDDESVVFSYHMLIGLTLGLTVLLRIIWGFFGSHYAKFSSFILAPKELLAYFKSLLHGETKRYLGHNPASSYAALAMLLLAIGLGISGLLMVQGVNSHFFEEVHEVLAYVFLILVILHVAGVLFHHIRHRDGMLSSMVTGLKEKVGEAKPISGSHPTVALIFLLFVGGFASYLGLSYNAQARELDLFGNKIQMGEQEHGEETRDHDEEHHEHDDDDDDH